MNTANQSNLLNVPLRRRYPISALYIVRMLLPWLSALGASLLLHGLASPRGRIFEGFELLLSSRTLPESASGEIAYDIQLLTASIVAMMSFLLLAKAVYLKLFLRSYYYAVRGEHLVIRAGVLLRETVAIQLAHITEISVQHTIADAVFGLSEIKVSTPALNSKAPARIPGLPRRTAMKLETVLFQLVERASRARDARVERNPAGDLRSAVG